MSRHHRWTFTLHKSTEPKRRPQEDTEEQFAMRKLATLQETRFLIWQWEKTTDGNHHIQGYIEWQNHKTMNATKAAIGFNHVHLEVAKGTAEQNIKYCSKEDSRVAPELAGREGEPAQQGQRNDWHGIRDKIKAGTSLKELCETDPHMVGKYPSGVSTLMKNLSRPERRHPVSIFYWTDESGAGKTRWTTETFSEADPSGTPKEYREAYWVPDYSGSGPVWMDGYSGQRVCVFDEFTGQYPRNFILKLMDGQPITVMTKGGSTPFQATVLVFLSNYAITSMYHEQIVGLPPFQRRLIDFGIDIKDPTSRRWVEDNLDQIICEHWNSKERYSARQLQELQQAQPGFIDLTGDDLDLLPQPIIDLTDDDTSLASYNSDL